MRKGRKGGAERKMGRRYSGRAFCERSLVSVCMCGSLPHIQTPHTQALLCLYVVSTRVFYPVLSSFFFSLLPPALSKSPG